MGGFGAIIFNTFRVQVAIWVVGVGVAFTEVVRGGGLRGAPTGSMYRDYLETPMYFLLGSDFFSSWDYQLKFKIQYSPKRNYRGVSR